MVQRARQMLAAILPSLGLLVLIEAGLRLSGEDFALRTLEIRARGPHAVELLRTHFTGAAFVPDPQLFWRPRPGHPPFNPRGWRGPELDGAKAPGEYRILALGDSNTIGHAVTWVDALDRLDPALFGARSISVVNAGVYGYTSYQGKLRLRELLPLHPDLVLISFGGNDVVRHVAADKDQPTPPVEPWWVGRLRVLDALRYYGVKLRPAPAAGAAGPVPRVSLADYVANLEEMVALVRAAGGVPLLLTRPLAHDTRAPGSRDPAGAYCQATVATAERLGVGLVDVDAIANHAWSLYVDHAHFNAHGHRVVGERVARAVVGLLRDGRYDLRALRYEAQEPYERLTNALRAGLDATQTFTSNLAAWRADPALPPPGALWQADFSRPSAHWRVEAPPGVDVRPRGRALCFETTTAGAVTVLATPPARPAYGLAWVEIGRQGALAARLFWSADGSFSEDAVTGTLFTDRGPRALVQTLPLGVRTLRVDFYHQNAPAPVCLEQLAVVPVGAPF